MKRPILAICFLFILVSCSHRSRTDADVSSVRIDPVTIHRYDLALFAIDPANLQAGLEKIRPEFGFFLDTDLSDTIKLLEMRRYLDNERNIKLYQAVKQKYPELNSLEKDLTEAFRHYRFYFPDRRLPRVYTYISGGDYENMAEMADSVLLIAIDDFLGKNYEMYKSDGVPLYRMHRMEPGYILPAAMTALYSGTAPQSPPEYTLLEQMIDAGKLLWFIDAMIPATPDYLKIGYTKEQWEWAEKNIQHVWAAILENQLLYSPAGQTLKTFMADGPFTADFTRESPPRLGNYLGWNIVSAYMEQNKSVTLQQLLEEKDAQKILTLSRYKPKK